MEATAFGYIKLITVYYENEIVGEFIADVIVENLVILELKSVRRVVKAHEVQLVNYLAATGKDVGLILNFAEKGVEVKRKVRELDDLSWCSTGDLLAKIFTSARGRFVLPPLPRRQVSSSWLVCLNFSVETLR